MERGGGAKQRWVGRVFQMEGTTNATVLRPDKVDVLRDSKEEGKRTESGQCQWHGAYR